jgi:vitamin B12 transporter
VEFTFRARAGKLLDLGGSYTYTDTEAEGSPAGFGLTPGSRLLRRPRHTAALDVHGRFAAQRAGVSLTGLYVGERADIDPVSFGVVEAGDYLLFNLAFSYDLPRGVRLLARVDNLLDEDYQDVLGFGTPRSTHRCHTGS